MQESIKTKISDIWVDLEIPTWLLAILVYLSWFVLTASAGQLPVILVFILGGFLICLHGSLQHEAIHGHPSRWEDLNTSLVFLPLSLWLPYVRYRDSHRKHHRCEVLTDPLQDPESFYVYKEDWQNTKPLFRFLLLINQTLIGRLVLGPILFTLSFWYGELKLMIHGDLGVLRTWIGHILGCVFVVFWVVEICELSLIYYWAMFVWPGLALTLLRSYLEHRPDVDNGRSTAIVEGSWLTQLLFLNNNFHLLHHQKPEVPWFQIKGLYDADRERWQELNQHYVFKSYWQVAVRYLFSPKDHPALS